MGKVLVSYFSATGATKRLAEKIANLLGAELFEIEPVEKYTLEDLDWTDKRSRSTIEMRTKNFRTSTLRKLENPDQYDTIILGFPVWWYKAPTIINTFIEENHIYGKKVYVFVTSGATGVESSFRDLKKKYPNINFISGRRFNWSFRKEEVLDWIYL